MGGGRGGQVGEGNICLGNFLLFQPQNTVGWV